MICVAAACNLWAIRPEWCYNGGDGTPAEFYPGQIAFAGGAHADEPVLGRQQSTASPVSSVLALRQPPHKATPPPPTTTASWQGNAPHLGTGWACTARCTGRRRPRSRPRRRRCRFCRPRRTRRPWARHCTGTAAAGPAWASGAAAALQHEHQQRVLYMKITAKNTGAGRSGDTPPSRGR